MPKLGRREAVYGPYKVSRGRWRIFYVGRDGRRSNQDFADEGEAQGAIKKARRGLLLTKGLTVAEAIDKHEEAMRAAGAKPSSLTTTRFRLGGFFKSVMDEDFLACSPGTTSANSWASMPTATHPRRC